MIGYIYLTTNTVNGKQYLGQHRYDAVTSGYGSAPYLGSGVTLKRAVRKYGRGKFTVQIIEECATPEELNQRETWWIAHYQAAKSPNFYNRAELGYGGSRESLKRYWAQFTPEERKRLRDWAKHPHPHRRGFQHSEETKRKIGAKSVGRNWGRKTPVNGKNNPMHGRSAIREQNLKWFTDGTTTKYLPADGPIPDGFVRGRAKMKRTT